MTSVTHPAILPPGHVVAERYEILETIGEGGMGAVYRVTDRKDGQVLALKLLKDTTEGQAACERRFRREYRALARLRHPAVVDVFDTGIFDGHLFFVMEFVKGHTLREWGTLTPIMGRTDDQLRSELDFYLQTLVTVLDALSDVHQSGIVHRDLKPQNIMIDHEGAVRIMDFGVALELRAPTSETSSNMILGTVGYVSPEEVRGMRLDARADLYSVGAMLYEYVTGQPAFDDDNPIVAFTRMLKERPVPPRKIQPFISTELEGVAMKLLEQDPDDRYQSAEEAAFALNLCLDSGEGKSTVAAHTASLRFRVPTLYSSRFIGQQAAFHLLGRLLEKSQRSQGCTALVVGEAGIGKTRLIQEVAVSDDARRVVYLRGGCFEREGVYYQPFVEMLGEYVKRIGKTARRHQLMERLYDADLFPLMRELARSGKDDAPTPSPGPEEKIRLFEAVARLASDLGKDQPLLVHLDDMHFADELTLELTRYVVRNLKSAAVLVVVGLRLDEVRRPEAAAVRRFLEDMRREGLVDAEVKLARLSREEVAELVASLGRMEPSPDLVDAVFRLTDGIPYFVEEVMKTVAATGKEPSRGPGDLPIPTSIAEIVQSQLESFKSEERDVLRDAAHIGTDFEFDLLLEVTGREEGQLLDMFDEFIRKGALQEISSSRSDAYRFTHPAVRETLLRQMSDRKKKKTHLRIARASEELYHDRRESELAQNIEEIARQYRLGGHAEKAFEYGWIAAKKALERRAFDAALRHLGGMHELATAREIEPSGDQWMEMILDLGTCYERTGRLTEARELYETELARLRREGEPSALADVSRRLARIFVEEGRTEDALAELRSVVAQAERLDPASRVELQTELARLLESRGSHEEAMDVILPTLGLAEAEAVTGPLADAMGLLGSIFTSRGEHVEASRYLEQALEIARTTRDPEKGRAARILELLAENAHQTLDSALEIRFYEECLDVLRKARDLLGEVTPLARMGRAFVVLGEMDRGNEVIQDAMKRCRRFALSRSLPVALEAKSLHSIYRGRVRAARAELLEAYDLAETMGDVSTFFQVSLSLGSLLTGLLAFNEAKGYLRQAMSLAEAKDNTLWKVQVLSAQAELSLLSGHRTIALDRLAAVEGLEAASQALLTPRHFVPSYLSRARLSEEMGDLERAHTLYIEAFESMKDVVAPFMLAQCHMSFARFLRRIGKREQARQELERSRTIWAWLGTSHMLAAYDEDVRAIESIPAE